MGIDRRKFLKGMGSLALFSIVPSKVLGGPNHIAPSDQLGSEERSCRERV